MATKLEEAADLVWEIKRDADAIEPGLERINRTGGVVAGALPLLYGFAEAIVVGATYVPEPANAELQSQISQRWERDAHVSLMELA